MNKTNYQFPLLYTGVAFPENSVYISLVYISMKSFVFMYKMGLDSWLW